MCYDKTYLTKRQERYAKRYGSAPDEVAFIKEQLGKINMAAVYHASGFEHPLVPVITSGAKKIELYSWGLIPNWIKSPIEAVTMSNRTINARAETLFEKPAFRESARERRCLVLVDGFFEHHHKSGKTFPYHIRLQDDEPMTLAGLWDEWIDATSGVVRRTYTLVTTRANSLMGRIHNNPKAEEGPRMPLVLPQHYEADWLGTYSQTGIEKLIKEVTETSNTLPLESFTVKRLRGKEAVGNTPEALVPFAYQELETQQGSLF
jgi:putative SOS response-associated peptidase YedK